MAPEPALWRVRIARNSALLAARARMARSLGERLIGLLGRQALGDGEGLILRRCRAIHTCGMRLPIDAVFVDRRWTVLAIREALPAWRVTPVVWRGEAVVELPAGSTGRAGLRVGDQLVVEVVDHRE